MHFHHRGHVGIPAELAVLALEALESIEDVLGVFSARAEALLAQLEGHLATQAQLNIGDNMDDITLGDTAATADLVFNGAPPAGVVVAFAIDNDAVATLGGDVTQNGNTFSQSVTPVGAGSATLSVTVTGPDGAELFLADGVTPFPVPAPDTFSVVEAAATSATLSIEG